MIDITFNVNLTEGECAACVCRRMRAVCTPYSACVYVDLLANMMASVCGEGEDMLIYAPCTYVVISTIVHNDT